MKQTKGKWIAQNWVSIRGLDVAPIEIVCEYNEKIADINPNLYGAHEVKANAKLIAAAPEMLEALEWIEHHALQDGCSKESLRSVAEAAIKEATV